MKKLNNLLFLFMLGIIGIATGCSDEAGTLINKSAEDGTLTFHLNLPKYSNGTYVLNSSESTTSFDTLTCDQPEYGYKAAVKYTIQVSFSEDFAKHDSLPSTINGETLPLNVGEFNLAVARLYGEGNMPNPTVNVNVYIRLKAFISSAVESQTDSTLKVPVLYSNAIKINARPYFVLLKDADPVYYYMIGDPIGDGSWTNDAKKVGTSILPMFVIPGNTYDATTGKGTFQYSGYFAANNTFKIIGTPGSWGEQYGNSNAMGFDAVVHNNGGSNNFGFTEAGFYTVFLNTVAETVTYKKNDSQSPTEYASIGLIGDFNSWAGDAALTKVPGTNVHIWTGSVTIPSAGGLKFRANGAWDVSWGGSTFPFSLSTGSGNIPAKAGTYTVYFNDLDGTYLFVAQ